MIKLKDTRVEMQFDSGSYTGSFHITHPALAYPNTYKHGISPELEQILEIAIAATVAKILETDERGEQE